MATGIRRLGRKRFAEATKYLKAVVADNTKPDRMRMQAVESLLAIYDRNDRTLAQYEQRKRAAEAAQGAQDVPEQGEAPSAPQQTPLDAARAFLTEINARAEG